MKRANLFIGQSKDRYSLKNPLILITKVNNQTEIIQKKFIKLFIASPRMRLLVNF